MNRSSARRLVVLLACAILGAGCRSDEVRAQPDPYDSGGPLSPEQASYDVTFYDLALEVNPADSSIHGALTVRADIVHPTKWLVLDLDPLLAIESVRLGGEAGEEEAAFDRRGGRVWVDLVMMRQPRSTVEVAIGYGGRPRVAPNPPWDGGFTWARTPGGDPWIATSCQMIGADVWWPVKDHPSDEPDSMALHISVPDPLVVASNGRLDSVSTRAVPGASARQGWSTYHWFISMPINVYNVALNIAPYRHIEDEYESITGESVPLSFYVLPEDHENGLAFVPEIKEHLRFFEELLGPYPFRADKYGVAQTPHLGMEHQTIIAYGADFNNAAMTGRDYGFDALHHHELSHEWWGNLITNADWSDMWLHEGTGSYMQALYAEYLRGMDAYLDYMMSMRGGIQNVEPVAPYPVRSSREIYGGDIYSKGAWVLHSLRYLIGEEGMMLLLRRMLYPDPEREQVTDGTHTRFVTTDDFHHLAEQISGTELDWFFELYLRQPELPELVTRRDGPRLTLEWRTPDDRPFPMPVEVQIDGETQRVEMEGGQATLEVQEGAEVVVDPGNWILKK